MQVSPTLNSIAAPLLYRSITIDANTPLPYETFSGHRVNLQRLTSDKVANLKYIDEVTLRNGDVDCDYHIQKLPAAFTLNMSTLRIHRDHDPEKSFDFPRGQCKCGNYLRPRKIIYLDTLSQHVMHLDRILHNEPEVVTITTLFRRESAPESLRYDYTGHIINICLTIGIASRLVFVFPPYSPHCADTRSYYRSIWTDLRRLMFQAAVRDGSPDFVVVNIESIAAESILEADKEGNLDVEITTAAFDKAYSRYRSTSRQIEAGKPRTGQFKFVSLQTYFEEYDWKGEFTDSEVRGYLNERKRDQAESV